MKMYYKNKYMIIMIIVLTMLFQVVGPVVGGFVYADDGPNDLGNIFTDVTITIKNGPEEVVLPIEDGDAIEITGDTKVGLKLQWEIGDEVDLNSGDFATLTIPSIFEGGIGGNLEWDGDMVATFIVDDGILRVEFNEVLAEEGLIEREGIAWVWLDFKVSEFEGDVTQTIKFEDIGNKTFTITAKPQGITSLITKSGSPNQDINAEFVNWVINVNTSLDKLEDAYLYDDIPEGLELIPDSIEIYDLTMGYDGVVKQEVPSSKTATGFPIHLGEINSAYQIRYKTKILDYSQPGYNNIAKLQNNGVEYLAPFDIGQLELGSAIDKKGVANNGGNNSTEIEWTIDVNKSELNLSNVTIDDTGISSGQTFKEGSIKIFKLAKSGSNWSPTSGDIKDQFESPTVFPVNLGGLNKEAYRIVFTTDINYGEYHPSNEFTNNAVLKVNGDEKGEAPAKVTVTREKLIEKFGEELTSYGQPYIKWTIHVNKANHNITNATITDNIGAGLKLNQDSIKVFEGNSQIALDLTTHTPTKSISDLGDSVFKANLGDINTHYRIEYTTDIIDPTASLGNEAELSGTGLAGAGITAGIIKTGELEPGNTVTNSYTKTKELNKTIDDVSYDGLNHTEKTMSWKISVNAIKEEVTSLTITDTFSPANSMVFLEESVKVVNSKGATIVRDTDYTLTDNKAGGFVLEFTGRHKPLERAQYDIYYKTSFDPDDVLKLGNGGTLNTTEKYINNVVFTGTTKDVKGTPGNINTPGTANYDIETVVFNGGKKDGVLDRPARKIKWNIYVNAMGQNLKGPDFVITDTISSTDSLDPGQEYDQTTLIVREYSLNKNGSINLNGVTLEKDVDYTVNWDDNKKQFTLTFPGGIDKPYMVQFYTNILGISKQKYINTADVTGKTNPYKKEVTYSDHNNFLTKDASGVTAVHTDDEVTWKININKSLSDIEPGATLEDTISNGLVYMNDSLVIKSGGTILVEGADKDYTLDKSIENGETKLTITFKVGITTEYIVEYKTVVLAENGVKVQNNAKFNGESSTIKSEKHKEFTVTQYAGGTGSGVRSGLIKVEKSDKDDSTKKLRAGFSLYYLLNGDKQYIKDNLGNTTHYTNAQGILEFKNLRIRMYYLEEVEAPLGYTFPEEGPYELELTTTTKSLTKEIKNERPKVDITAIKEWIGGPSPKPTIEFQLYQNGAEYGSLVELEDGTTEYTWKDLYQQDENGENYTYTVKEVGNPVNYNKVETGLMVTNTYISPKTTITGKKIWVDGPDIKPVIKLQLYRNNIAYEGPVELVNGVIEHTWINLDKTDENGVDYKYTIKEVKRPANYGTSTSDDELTITNTYGSPTMDIIGMKSWVNGPGIRPTIELQLYRDGTPLYDPVILEDGDISYNWKDQDITDEKGNEYVYTVDEVNVPENYIKSLSGLTVTNTYVIPTMEVTGTKKWVGGSSTKPSVELQLYKDGLKVGVPVKLDGTETTPWTHTWDELDKTDIDGKDYRYTVDEVTVPSYYYKSISSDGLTVTNTYNPPTGPYYPPTDPTKPVDPTNPTKPVELPTDPTKPVDPDPTDPTDPVDPTEPVEPTDPVDPPTDPKTPVRPPTSNEENTPKDTPKEGEVKVPEGGTPKVNTPPKNGTVTVDKNGKWTYTPNPGYEGKDKFSIIITHPDGSEEEIFFDIEVETPLGVVEVETLPKTGQVNSILFYLAGLFLIIVGIFFRKRTV